MINYNDVYKIKQKILQRNSNIDMNYVNNIINILLYSEFMMFNSDDYDYWSVILSEMIGELNEF